MSQGTNGNGEAPDLAGNLDRVLADAKARLKGRNEFVDAQGNIYRPHPDGVEVETPTPSKFPYTYDDAARLSHTLGRQGPLSASERAQQRDAYIAAVDGMAGVLRETVAALDVERKRVNVLDDQMTSRTSMEAALHKAVKALTDDVQALRIVQIEFAQQLTERANRLGAQVYLVDRDVVTLRAHHDGHVEWHKGHLSFLARLRWLLTGV